MIDTKYTTYGFAYIQDMVDHAIIRLQANITQEVGVVLQQFPYPCWIRDRSVGKDNISSFLSLSRALFHFQAHVFEIIFEISPLQAVILTLCMCVCGCVYVCVCVCVCVCLCMNE